MPLTAAVYNRLATPGQGHSVGVFHLTHPLHSLFRNHPDRCKVNGQRSEQKPPIRSLGRDYTADLTDRHMADAVTNQLKEGLERIDRNYLPSKYKVWCHQFTLYPRLMWPLKMCEITVATVKKLDAKASNFIRKWLGLPRCLSDAALFGRNALQLPLKSTAMGYRLRRQGWCWNSSQATTWSGLLELRSEQAVH